MNPAEPTKARPTALNRRLWIVAGIGATAGMGWSWWNSAPTTTATGSAAAGGPASSSPERLGADFWALTLPQPDGTDLALSSFQGRALLLNFWATWCPPCIREMPLLDRFYREQSPKGLQMLGIAVDSPTPVRSFLTQTPVGFPVALAGANGSNLARSLGNSLGGLPYTVLANAQGQIIRRQMGELNIGHLNEWAGLL